MEVIIHQSTDYDLFEPIVGNRNINMSKVNKICEDIKNGFNMLPYCPVIVNETIDSKRLQVIDGQHRVEVSRQSENPVYYVICNTLTLQQIAMMNSRGEKWKAADFLNCYIKLGLTDYAVLRETMEAFSFPMRVIQDLLMTNQANPGSTDRTTEKFQSGQFKCNFLEETKSLLTLVQSVFGDYDFCKDVKLITAVQKLKRAGKCDFNKLKQKIKQAPEILTKQGSPKLYLVNIEQVYNHRDSIRKTIY